MQTLEFRDHDAMPILGLGTWKSSPGEVGAAVKAAIAAGYRHLDCAAIYRNEAEIGQALRECFAEGLVQREELWVTSKLWNDSHRPEHVRSAIDQTLADLQLDYLDLYLIHWPVCLPHGQLLPETGEDLIALEEQPIADTWQAMEALITAGVCRHLGVSNFSTKKLAALCEVATVPPELNQIELHPHLQQAVMLDFCTAHNIHLTAYSPLGSGDRPDAFKAADEPVLLENPTITMIADRHQATPAQVLLAWAIARGTAAIPKSTNPDRLAENLAAADVRLTETDLAEIATLDRHYRYVSGSFWAMDGSPYSLETLWDETA
ncbi:MAG: aldo/keto reductase [Coleofasciculaceae cyanobacterium RL_1_1]|nr:aldo/keto reductase [Coleofasciculaceae cyanobacterium RL_1_1]